MPNRTKNTKTPAAVRVVSYCLAALFVCAGLAKLSGLQMIEEQFAAWNYPSSFMYTVGSLEVVAGLLLIPAKTRAIGTLFLGLLMIGAAATHYLAQEWGAIVVPAAILALLVWLGRRSLVYFGSPSHHGAPHPSR